MLASSPRTAVQAIAIAYTGVYCAFVTYVILMVVRATVGLRVSEEEEMEGLDLSQHGESVA